MNAGPFERSAADLAPGDRSVLDADWSDFSVEAVRGCDHPDFEDAYARLWREFGERGEMERREVIESRFTWNPGGARDGRGFFYEMLVLRAGGEVVAVRDHTVIAVGPLVVVHLSHVLVEPAMRGRGLASWLRALPLTTARRVSGASGERARDGDGQPIDADPTRIVLAAEMEPVGEGTAAVARRLRSYARAGFRMVDPARIHYLQPDFRAPDVIEGSGLQAVPLCLVLRRVGREQEATMRGDELRSVVSGLYAMFGEHVRGDHMAALLAGLEDFPRDDEAVALHSPDAGLTTARPAAIETARPAATQPARPAADEKDRR